MGRKKVEGLNRKDILVIGRENRKVYESPTVAHQKSPNIAKGLIRHSARDWLGLVCRTCAGLAPGDRPAAPRRRTGGGSSTGGAEWGRVLTIAGFETTHAAI